VTINDLMKFVDTKITATIERALAKVNLAAERFGETKTDLNDVWSSLRSELITLAIEAKTTMFTLGNEALEAARRLKLSEPDQERVKKSVSNATEDKGGFVAVLFWISLVELVGYVVFFCWKRKKTHGFKKID